MLNFLPGPLRGCLSLLLYGLNTLFWSLPLFIMAAAKALIPIRSWRRFCSRILNRIAGCWIWCNSFNQHLTGKIRWHIQGMEDIQRSQWYLVLANHQSWVDILVLQRIFYRKIPFLKFFIKKELIWLPILGQAWWAMDFPFVKRYSKRLLQKKPALMGKDLEITRRACRKFKTLPVSIMNFVEGTRFTRKKHRHQQSPYRHLLKTKAGGIALVLGAMGDQIHRILDVTIVYSGKGKSFWAFLCGHINEIHVQVRAIPISAEMLGNYSTDQQFRLRFQDWLNELWTRKDQQIEEMTSV